MIKTSPWLDDARFLSTNACATGSGAYFQGQYFHTPFPGHDINILELLTITVALKLWGPALQGLRFIIKCDNANSVLALNSGRSRTRAMQLCLREIWFLSARFDFELVEYHIPGQCNTIADHLSRWHLSPTHKAHFCSLMAGIRTTQIPCPTELFEFDAQC